MGKHAVLLSFLIGLACHGSGDGSSSDGSTGSAPPIVGGWGGPSGTGGAAAGPIGATGGSPSPGGGSSTGGAPGAGGQVDASPTMSGDPGTCPFSMAGQACGPAGATCSVSTECVARRCDCLNGTWACAERPMPCGGMCPAPQSARCGDPCTGTASGCLCHCGGGPNYGGCSCSAGRWQCSCGGR